jgi:hypothetical protein
MGKAAVGTIHKNLCYLARRSDGAYFGDWNGISPRFTLSIKSVNSSKGDEK